MDDIIERIRHTIQYQDTPQTIFDLFRFVNTLQKDISKVVLEVNLKIPPNDKTDLMNIELLSKIQIGLVEAIHLNIKTRHLDKPDELLDYYRKTWNQPNWPPEIILESIVNSLLRIETILKGIIVVMQIPADGDITWHNTLVNCASKFHIVLKLLTIHHKVFDD
jgi:hypothetical protein